MVGSNAVMSCHFFISYICVNIVRVQRLKKISPYHFFSLSSSYTDQLVEEIGCTLEEVRDWQQQDEIIQNDNVASGISESSISSSATSVVPKAELYKRSISESPNHLTASRETLTGSNLNISTSRPNISGSSNKFGSTFSIVKHKKIDLTSFNEERPEEQKTPERRKSGTDDYVLEENVLKKAASINLDHSFSGK